MIIEESEESEECKEEKVEIGVKCWGLGLVKYFFLGIVGIKGYDIRKYWCLVFSFG